MTPKCYTCRFWCLDYRDKDDLPEDARGLCHRHAPSPTKGGFEQKLVGLVAMLSWHFTLDENDEKEFRGVEEVVVSEPTWWPATFGSEWCGEHEPKEPAA